MPAAPRIRPFDRFSPRAWAPFQLRSRVSGPLLVLHCWTVITAAVAVRTTPQGARMDVAGGYLAVLGKASVKA